MKTKYCSKDCLSGLHTAICIYKRRDAGEFDELAKLKKAFRKLEKKVNKLEQELYEGTGVKRYDCNGKAYC